MRRLRYFSPAELTGKIKTSRSERWSPFPNLQNIVTPKKKFKSKKNEILKRE